MATSTNLYRAITSGDFPEAKNQFLSLMREKLNAVVAKEYKAVAADFAQDSTK